MYAFKKYIKKYWKPFLIALCFLVIEAFADLMQPTIMSKLIDDGVYYKNMDNVIKYGSLMLIITAIGAIGAVGRNIISSNVSQSFGSDLRLDLFKKVQSLSFENIDKLEPASIITRLTNDVTQIQGFVHGMMRVFVKSPIVCVGSIVMASILNPKMAVILFIVVPIVSIIIYFSMKTGYPYFTKVQKALDKLNEVMREYLSGVRVVKAFNRFNYETDRFEEKNKELADQNIKAMRVMALFNPFITFVVNIGIAAVLWLGGIKVNKGEVQVGQIIAFVNYMTQILFSLMTISNVFMMFIRAKASAERISSIFLEENTIKSSEKYIENFNIKGSIEFENVSFSYNNESSEPVLKDINLVINPSETVGIIGATGSGKSTLVNLILRFYDTLSGKIKVDGIDVKEYNIKKLREKIAIVPQKSVLFSGTILDNIKWGKEDATLEEVIFASKISMAHEFIVNFKEGYNTELGQGGVNLSGGQKQRIAIARALVKKPEILILDDSTSAVDVNTEAKIREGLKKYSMNLTTIIIAQRITSVMRADKIIVLDNGKVAAVDTHDNLMKKCKIYQDIFASQMGKEFM
ncbi:ATP-binding cassette, subfamily B [Clostridium sp. USBA 49]|uniref:ABC transporter ATP-binding protein n=1 Tax=Clostridium sp. USBA 49 TaxID=1881060 RepID=UPI00099B207B|nr:ABC transporter ATP-binding protein [Clostridium sp. USBA 49]SKA73463.1 ATP-binding cassette, subfamily B [Clostridium sp. USBA 49]